MIGKVEVATANGTIELPGGTQFWAQPYSVDATFPITVKPDGQDTGAFGYYSARTKELVPFGKLVLSGLVPGSKWLVIVAGAGEHIGSASNKQIVLIEEYLPQTVKALLGDVYLNLPTKADGTATWFDTAPFRRVDVICNTPAKTGAGQPNVTYVLRLKAGKGEANANDFPVGTATSHGMLGGSPGDTLAQLSLDPHGSFDQSQFIAQWPMGWPGVATLFCKVNSGGTVFFTRAPYVRVVGTLW